jgi:hypothetical protein
LKNEFIWAFPVYLHRSLSMNQSTNILQIAQKQPLMYNELDILQDIERAVPGSVHYSIKRYKKEMQWSIDDTGMLVYHYERNNAEANYLELKFCVTGNVYCRQKQTECDFCKFSESKTCVEKVDSMDVLSFSFKPSYLTQFVKGKKQLNISDEVLSFTHTSSFSKILPLCNKTRKGNRSLAESYLHRYAGKHFYQRPNTDITSL